MPELKGKTALVTGGGSGIGAVIAARLISEGARVVICGRSPGTQQRVTDKLSNCSYVQADVSDEKAVTALFRKIDTVDIVVANAGVAESAPIHKTDMALWTRMVALNLTGAFLTAREAINRLREKEWGRVVFIASTAGLKGYPYVSAYCAAKHGVVGLARSLALETARFGTTVNTVCPGFTETPMLQQSIDNITAETGMNADQVRQKLLSCNPMGRFIQPEEVAGTVAWLCSEGAASVTGQAIAVSGGEV